MRRVLFQSRSCSRVVSSFAIYVYFVREAKLTRSFSQCLTKSGHKPIQSELPGCTVDVIDFFYRAVTQELERFLKKADKAAKGEEADVEEDFEKHKLDEDNIGFQMLKKAG